MTNKPSWDDDTQEGFRQWPKKKYGVEPPIVNLPVKEVKMADSKTGDKTFISQPTTTVKPLIVTPLPLGTTVFYEEPIKAKRTRKGRWVNTGVTVTTYQEATVNVFIPKRPEGMKKVTIEITLYGGGDLGTKHYIPWPEGMTALEAIKEHFPKRLIDEIVNG